MTPLEAAGFLGVGAIAGVINTIAGGGSLLTLPLLVESGMSATVANATNRVAVWMQSATSATRFHAKGALELKPLGPLAATSLAGTVVGAAAAAVVDDAVFKRLLALVFFVMGAVFAKRVIRGKASVEQTVETLPTGWKAHAWMALAGLYAGAIQAGVGVLIIWILHIANRTDIVRANAAKTFLVWVWTCAALAVFVWYGLVAWPEGLMLGAGGVVGAWVGVAFATRVNPRALQGAVAVAVWVAAGRFAGLW